MGIDLDIGLGDLTLDGLNLDIDDFDIDLGFDDGLETRYMKPKLKPEIKESMVKYREALKFAKVVEIEKNCRHFAIINGSFCFGDFIEALIVENNYHVKELTISTLSMNQNNVDSLRNLIDGDYADKINLIISAYFYSHERHGLVPYIYDKLDIDDKFQLAVAGTHCKTCSIETYEGLKLIVHGSANYRSSANIEQIMIEENEELYDFNQDYQNAIIDKYSTINKEIRGEKLWQVVQTGKPRKRT